MNLLLSRFLSFCQQIGARLYPYPAPVAFLLSVCLCLIAIYGYGVLNFDAMMVTYAKRHNLELSPTAVSPALFALIFEDVSKSYLLMVGLNSACVCLLVRIAKQLGFGLLTQWALVFLVCFHLLFNDYRQYIFTAPFYWLLCLSAIRVLFSAQLAQRQKAVIIFFLMYFAAGIHWVAWFWLWLLPLFFYGKSLRFENRVARYHLRYFFAYYALIFVVFFLPHVLSGVSGANMLTLLLDSRQTNIIEIGDTLSSAWLREEDSLMSYLFLAVGSVSVVLLHTLFSVGVVSLFLMIYAFRKRQFSYVTSWRIRLFLSVIAIDILLSTVYVFIRPNYASSAFFIQVLLLLILASPGLAYVFKKWQHYRYDTQWQLIIAWLLIGYIISGLVPFGPSNVYLREAGEAYQGQVFVSNHPKVLFYGARNPLPDSADKWSQSMDSAKNDTLILYRLGRDEVLPVSLQHRTPVRVFQNRHDDKVLVFSPE